jgi:CBS domain-containing protein
MNVRELMTADPEACVPTDSCAEAAEIMRRRNCGFVPVIDSRLARHVIGVVTDRDLALYLATVDRVADEVPVSECMHRPPTTIRPDASLEEAAMLLEQCAIHRLPVVEHGRLIGVFSLKNVARQARSERPLSGQHDVERQLAEIVEAIAIAQ